MSVSQPCGCCDMETLKEVLRSVVEGINYKGVRAEQRRAILSFLQGKDAFVFLPRGSGKSFCFYVLPLFLTNLEIIQNLKV